MNYYYPYFHRYHHHNHLLGLYGGCSDFYLGLHPSYYDCYHPYGGYGGYGGYYPGYY